MTKDIEYCTALHYYSDAVNASKAFRHTIAKVIMGIKYSDVTVAVVEDVPDIFRRERSRMLSVPGVTVDYRLSFNYIEAGYTNLTSAFNLVSKQLINSVENGNFTKILKQESIEFHSSAFLSAVASVNRLRITSIHTRRPQHSPTESPVAYLPPVYDLPTDDTVDVQSRMTEKDTKVAATVSVIFFVVMVCIAFLIVRRRMTSMYQMQSTIDDDDNVNNNSEVEMKSTAIDDETVVWFNPNQNTPAG